MKKYLYKLLNVSSVLLIFLLFFLPIIRWVGGGPDEFVVVSSYPFEILDSTGYILILYPIVAGISLILSLLKPRLWIFIIQEAAFVITFIAYIFLIIATCLTDGLQIIILILIGVIFITHQACLLHEFNSLKR